MTNHRTSRRGKVLSVFLAATFLSACHPHAGSVQTLAPATSSPGTSALSIASVDNTSPMSATPLYISTKGLGSGDVTVTFTDSLNGSVALKPIRVAADGTVVVAVPMYFDATTAKTISTPVKVAISQGAQTSAPVSLNVQDIPQFSDYGLPLGVISRSFYNYEIIALGSQLGALQATQASPQNHVDTTQEQADVQKLLLATIKARNDVDRIMTNNALVIPIGTLADGTVLNFDRTALQGMDRTIGVYVLALAPVVGVSSVNARLPNGKRAPLIDAKAVGQILSGLGSFFGVADSAQKLTPALSDPSAVHPTGDKIVAALTGAASLSALGGLLPTPATPVLELAGAVLGVAAMAVGGYLAWTDSRGIKDAAAKGDQATVTSLSNDFNKQLTGVEFTGLGVILGGFTAGNGSQITAFGTKVGSFIVKAGTQATLQGAGLLATAVGMFVDQSASKDEQTTANVANQEAGSSAPRSAQISGSVNATNAQGAILSGLSGVAVSSGGLIIGSAVADASGNYVIDVPLGMPGVNYANLVLAAYDPITMKVIASMAADLTGLAPGPTPKPMPTLTGLCSDSDAGSPDADDPDCD